MFSNYASSASEKSHFSCALMWLGIFKFHSEWINFFSVMWKSINSLCLSTHFVSRQRNKERK